MKPAFLPVLSGWTVPSGRVASLGTPSGNELALAGMLKAAQCRTSLVVCCNAVSGSSTTSAKLWVPAGALVQASAGETGAGTAWVYLSGITAPSAKDELVRPMGAGGGAAGACAKAGPADSSRAPIRRERKRSMRSSSRLLGAKQKLFQAKSLARNRDKIRGRQAPASVK